jgi:hypothetical protein
MLAWPLIQRGRNWGPQLNDRDRSLPVPSGMIAIGGMGLSPRSRTTLKSHATVPSPPQTRIRTRARTRAALGLPAASCSSRLRHSVRSTNSGLFSERSNTWAGWGGPGGRGARREGGEAGGGRGGRGARSGLGAPLRLATPCCGRRRWLADPLPRAAARAAPAAAAPRGRPRAVEAGWPTGAAPRPATVPLNPSRPGQAPPAHGGERVHLGR